MLDYGNWFYTVSAVTFGKFLYLYRVILVGRKNRIN